MNISYSSPLGALVFPRSIPHADFAHSTISSGWSISVDLVIRMALWAVSTISISIAFVLGPYADTTLSVPSAGSAVSIMLGVLVPFWAVSLIGFLAVTISNFVPGILFRSSPIQIVKAIVTGIVIAMTRLHPFWAGLNKSLEHQRMNGSLVRLPASIQSAAKVSTTFGSPNLHLRQHPSSRISNPSLVRNLIIGKLRDESPAFIFSHQMMLPHGRELICP